VYAEKSEWIEELFCLCLMGENERRSFVYSRGRKKLVEEGGWISRERPKSTKAVNKKTKNK
jgi:hypothetical protein